jgi:DDE superfamily endonuclease
LKPPESSLECARGPPILGLHGALTVTLTYLRRNRVQAEIAEDYGVSVLDSVDPHDYVGDKGFVGNDMITPFKKPPGGELLGWQKEFNSHVNKIRWVIEQAIANFKTWRAMHTDYRHPIATFTEAISAVVCLEFYRIA